MLQQFAIDHDALVDFLLRMVGTRSHSTEEGGAATVLADELCGLGFDVEVDELGNVVGTLELGPGPIVLLDCHLDTVVVDGVERWTRDPAGEVAGGRVYGRGTVDMKGPMAACVHGVAALRDLEVGTVVVTGTVAEELVEGACLVPVAERVRPDYVVICEPSHGTLAVGQRGRAEVVVDIEGRSCHSAHPEAGVNAADVMADVVVALRDVGPPHDPFLGDGLMVLTDMMSHPYPGLSVVPGRCVATYDRRTLVGESEDDVLVPVRAVVDDVAARWGTRGTVTVATDDFTTYTGVRVQAPNFAAAWRTAEDSRLVTAAVAGLEAVGLPATISHYGFCTNGSGTAGQLGLPTIGYGPGEQDQPHTVDESISLEDLRAAAVGYAGIVSSLLRTHP